MNWKGTERKQSWPNPGTRLDGVGKLGQAVSKKRFELNTFRAAAHSVTVMATPLIQTLRLKLFETVPKAFQH